MPEQPARRLRRPAFAPNELAAPTTGPSTGFRYAELHCRTNYSFLEGASHPDELVRTAHDLGYQALAVTDRNTLAGIVRAHVAARECGLKLLIGAEIVPTDGPPSVLLATDRQGYANLSTLITRGRRRAPKGECRIKVADISDCSDRLLCCVPLNQESQHRFAGRYQPGQSTDLSEDSLAAMSEIFGDRCRGLAELHFGSNDQLRLTRWLDRCNRLNIRVAAANDVHYHLESRRPLHDVLTAIRCRASLDTLGSELFPNGERHLKPIPALRQLFGNHSELLAETMAVADACRFSLDELRYEYPEELVPAGETPIGHLTRLATEGARQRYPSGVPPKIARLLQHELTLIEELRYEAYFLTVYDLVRFARERSILCQGRGSAANSVVCFCIGITSVDPDRIEVLFERFVSRERDEAPDIDVDFEHERREEVLQYLYDRYGRDRAGMTAEVITYRPRSAMRDVGKALSLSSDRIDKLASQLEHVDNSEQLPQRLTEGGIDPQSVLGRRLLQLVRDILAFPRHLSQHVGGMVMSRGPLHELVPIENAAMSGRTVIQWDKNDLDALGLLKVDCLSLGMLTCIRRCFDLIQHHHSQRWSLATVPAEDPAVYDMISQADTVGVFQIESRAQMSMLPRLRPQCFYDLVIEVAIVRPGPIQGDMVHPYLRRRSGDDPVDYPSDDVRQVLHRTLGVPIFQEQAMKLAIVAAGFSPGEADQLRRAMGAWRKQGVIAKFHQQLVEGMTGNGYDAEFAERVFKQISGFGEYGFPESHAASFALLVYVSSWIKRYHPAIFAAALINSQPMGFYAPAQLVRDAREHDVDVAPIDVNHSDWDCTLEERLTTTQSSPPDCSPHLDHTLTLRLGFRLLHGFPAEATDEIMRARRQVGRFASFEQFAATTQLSRALLRQLAHADAFKSLGINRRDALWNALPDRQSMPLFETGTRVSSEETDPELHAPTLEENVVQDYATAGLSLRPHPVSFLREQLNTLRILPAEELATHLPDRRVKVAGLVLMRQRPATAAGVTFMTLEDETGIANLVIFPNLWQRFRKTARFATALIATGRLQREGDIIHVVCDRLDDASEFLTNLKSRSRDFR